MELDPSNIERIVRLVIAELMRLEAETEEIKPVPFQPLQGSEKTILVLYAPVMKGLEEAWDQLYRLGQQGYTLIHVLPPEVSNLITPAEIKKKFQTLPIQVFSNQEAREQIKGITFQATVGVTLSRAEVAKVALAQTDTLFSDIVFQMLWQGCPVVLAQDGVMEPRFRIHPGSGALMNTIEVYLRKLVDYGARLVPARELASAVRETLSGSHAVIFQGQRRIVITAQDIEEAEGELVVQPGTIITPLAWDVAKHRGISIRREQG
jgi:hypothetical protein